MKFEFHVPETIICGGGSRLQAGDVAARIGIRKALLVSDVTVSKLPFHKEVLDCLIEKSIEVFDFHDLASEPSDVDVDKAVAALRAHGCDGAISLGGGSCIDTAKAACVLYTNGGVMSDFQGYHRVKKAGLPHIAIPTTAGTGSEVTRNTIINDVARKVKMLCLDNAFITKAAIVDYEMTVTMPAPLTAYVGVDALTHAIEGYVSRKASLLSDSYALLAIEHISGSILAAFHNPGDLTARENMMLGSTYAGMAFGNSSVCTVHGMSRPIGAYFHVPHGLSNAFLLPAVTARSIGGNFSRYAGVAMAMGLGQGGETDAQLAGLMVERLAAFNRDLAIPSMKAWGIDEATYLDKADTMAQDALDSGSPGNNPTLFTKAEIVEIYRTAYGVGL
ncbi:MAG TPA: iron-containing alcohol dehydrogenase [Clostridia bacterium]